MNAEGLVEINVLRLRNLIRQRARHTRISLPKLATDDIERLLEFITDAQNLQTSDDAKEKLRANRDRAFLLTLADTGLRVHEACKFKPWRHRLGRRYALHWKR